MHSNVTSINNKLIKPLLILETENYCVLSNNACKHCSVKGFKQSDKKTIDFNEIIEEFTLLSNKKGQVIFKNGAGALGLTEISLIQKSLENSLDVSITTEGIFVSKDFEQNIVNLLQKFPNKISYTVSLDGHTKEIYGLLRQKKYFKKACDFIKRQIQHGFSVATNFVVHQNNVKHLSQYLDFAVNTLGVKKINFIQLGLIGNAIKNKLKPAKPQDFFNEIITAFEKGNSKIKNAMETTFINAIQEMSNSNKHFECHGCVAGSKNFAFVKSNGNIYPCSSLESRKFLAGNIKETTLEKAMKSKAFKKARKLALKLAGQYPIIVRCPGRNISIKKDIKLAKLIHNYLTNIGSLKSALNKTSMSICFNRAW